MVKVNCELYRFTVKLKLKALFAHQLKLMDNDRPYLMDRHGTQSGWWQGPVATVHLLHGMEKRSKGCKGDRRSKRHH